MKYEQEPPFAVQVELSEGCNLYCDFCGLQGIRDRKDKNYKFMTLAVAERIAEQIAHEGWNARIEFAMHGEPTMNPKYLEIVKLFRKHLPKSQLMMTSNGGGIVKDPVKSLEDLFDAGLNIFAFDAYESVNIHKKIDKALEDQMLPWGEKFTVHYYPEEPVSPHSRYPRSTRMFIRVQDISVAMEGTHSTLNNHCGSGSPPLAEPMQARCAKPFREISFRWDGSVAICCNDWRGVYKIGSIRQMKLKEIWNHPRFAAARRALYHGRRDLLSPCDVCDAKSYRVGLLPDKKGKVKLPKPNKNDLEVMKSAVHGRPYTKPNKREWELINVRQQSS